MTAFPFVGGSYTARSVNFDAQVCLNLYPEKSESGTSKSASALIGTPGLTRYSLLNQLGTIGFVRGIHRFSATVAIAIVGDRVYKVGVGKVFTNIGTIDGLSTYARMADNGTSIMLVTGPNGYFIDPVIGTVTQIIDGSFTGGEFVGFVAGMFVWNKPGTGQFQYTDPYSTTISALNFYTAESSPDPLSALVVNHSEVWLYGPNSVEVWALTGDNSDPFSRIQGAQMETGIDAPSSLAKMDNTLFWLGGDDRGRGIVLRAVGYSQAQRVSTHAIEFAIASYGDISDAISFTYQQEGHTFFVLSFPAADKTWVFDAATGLWHERAWMDGDGILHRIRVINQIDFDGETLLGDWENPTLFTYRLDVFADSGTISGGVLKRVRACPHLSSDLKQQLFHLLQIDMETGGSTTPPGDDPQAMLQWSDDGGHTWSNEYWVSFGKLGEYKTRARWRRLGKSRDRVFRMTITDPVKIVITGASVEVTPCPT